MRPFQAHFNCGFVSQKSVNVNEQLPAPVFDILKRGAFNKEFDQRDHFFLLGQVGYIPVLCLMADLFDYIWKGARLFAMFADYLANGPTRGDVAEAHRPLVEALGKGSVAASSAMSSHIIAHMNDGASPEPI